VFSEADIRLITALAGAVTVVTILWDGFETIILPRRVMRRVRLTRLFYNYTWLFWSWIVNNLLKTRNHTDTYLSYFGPLSLLLLLIVWAVGLVFGFAFLHWSAGSIADSSGPVVGFGTYLYFSGTNFATLGLGDITAATTAGRLLTVGEAGLGLGFLALVLGYLPALNQSFASREEAISLLDARAGSPPSAQEMLRRHKEDGGFDELKDFLRFWEFWSSQLLSTHLSYPVLAFFRSQHDNQSWLSALTVVLDTCSLIITHVDGSCKKQAELTFAMARHAVVDLSLVFDTPPCASREDRLPGTDLTRLLRVLEKEGFVLVRDRKREEELKELRGMYEPYLGSLADYLCLAVPPWIPEGPSVDNWQTSAWGEIPRTPVTSKSRARHDRSRHFWNQTPRGGGR
jgi:voltage-gated potassium channel Kch